MINQVEGSTFTDEPLAFLFEDAGIQRDDLALLYGKNSGF